MKQQVIKNKKIYLETAWRIHSFYKELCANPPQGYEFVPRQGSQEKIYDMLAATNLSYLLLRKAINKVVPVNQVKAYVERFRKIPEDIKLTYAVNHLVFRNEPWLLDCEFALSIIGGDARHLKRFKGTIERALRSDYCKQIICWHEAAKKTLLHNLDCRGFRDKITTLPLATIPRNFAKTFDDKRIKLLFVNSSNISGQFELKGGREIMETFAILSKMFNNLEMVVRSDIPENIKGKYHDIPGLRIIEKVIPWQELEQEFKTADIFLMPTHVTPYQAFLDAMSYELPIITIDAWANPEIVEDGKTGFVCHRSERVEYYTDTYLPNWDTPKFLEGIQKTDPNVVSEIARKISYLIENVELRRNMGKLGRWEVENGKFSIVQRNKKLKIIFDEATS